jgi:transcriptional regulator with XRE-family HTH domain
MDTRIAIMASSGHIQPMNITLAQQLTHIGSQMRSRRLAMGLTQAEAAGRAGVAYRTWRRMEKDASASIEDLVRAAIALRCDQVMTALFPEPAASSMDELLARQKAAAGMMPGKRPKQARA